MPISLEEFRKLSTIPVAKAGVKGGKVQWSVVRKQLESHAWTVREVWDIAKVNAGEKGISRTRTKRWLDSLVKEGSATTKQDGLAMVYWINPRENTKEGQKKNVK